MGSEVYGRAECIPGKLEKSLLQVIFYQKCTVVTASLGRKNLPPKMDLKVK